MYARITSAVSGWLFGWCVRTGEVGRNADRLGRERRDPLERKLGRLAGGDLRRLGGKNSPYSRSSTCRREASPSMWRTNYSRARWRRDGRAASCALPPRRRLAPRLRDLAGESERLAVPHHCLRAPRPRRASEETWCSRALLFVEPQPMMVRQASSDGRGCSRSSMPGIPAKSWPSRRQHPAAGAVRPEYPRSGRWSSRRWCLGVVTQDVEAAS